MKLTRRRKEQPATGVAQKTLSPSRRVAYGKVANRQTPKVRAALWGIALCVATGVALVLFAIIQLDAAVAEVVASLGTGVLLAGFLLWLEPRLMRKVGETTQRIVDEGTAGLRERIAKLETLREAAASDLMDKVRERPDFDTTWELLTAADNRNLFSEDFKVRSGGNREILMEIAISDWPRIMDELMEPTPLDKFYIDIFAVSATEEAPVVASRWWRSESIDEAVVRFWGCLPEQGGTDRRNRLGRGVPRIDGKLRGNDRGASLSSRHSSETTRTAQAAGQRRVGHHRCRFGEQT